MTENKNNRGEKCISSYIAGAIVGSLLTAVILIAAAVIVHRDNNGVNIIPREKLVIDGRTSSEINNFSGRGFIRNDLLVQGEHMIPGYPTVIINSMGTQGKIQIAAGGQLQAGFDFEVKALHGKR